jgi:quinol---cytochrome c reductase iron-sulfur subunit, bacillus type
MNDPCNASPPVGRRNFFKEFLAALIGGVLGVVPVIAGLEVFLDPLRRKAGASSAVHIAGLEALPDDGIPRKFPVLANRVDAWNKFTQIPIGAVYLRRTGNQVQAFNAVCPHAGCNVDFLQERNLYLCPCHNSTFTVAGRIGDPSSPAARGLDALDVELRGNEVWVKFQNFEAGRREKIPVA